jgi:short-subunit dehydrogenase
VNPGHVVVTGAAGAIGSALARAMHAAWPSCALALVDRDGGRLDALAREVGGTAHVADLCDVDGLERLIAAIAQAGPIDGLVNCAGVMKVQQLRSWRWEDARALLAVDLLAPLRLQDLVVRGMTERGFGVIVNVASMAGKVPLKGATYYGASKAGLAMASRSHADLAPHGIRVVTVYPGRLAARTRRARRVGRRWVPRSVRPLASPTARPQDHEGDRRRRDA